MHRYTDSTRLIGNGAGNGLANPPGGISAEFIALMMVEFLDSAGQADIAFLDQVEKRHTSPDMFFGHADHQAQVGFDEVFFGLFRFPFDIIKIKLQLTFITLNCRFKAVFLQ